MKSSIFRPSTLFSLLLVSALLLAPYGDNEASATDAGTGCVTDYEPQTDYFPDKVAADYSTQWAVQYRNSYKLLTISPVDRGAGSAELSLEPRNYVLYQCGTPQPPLEGELAGAVPIQIPVGSVYLGLGMFAAVEQLNPDLLIGYGEGQSNWDLNGPGTALLPQISARMRDGSAREIPSEALEPLIELNPDVTFADPKPADRERIEAAGIPVVVFNQFSEPVLAGAEQAELLSLFTNQEAQALERATEVIERYNELKAMAAEIEDKPTVLVGYNQPGEPFTTEGSDRFPLVLVRDAGGVSALDVPGTRYEDRSIEFVIEQGADADFWWWNWYARDDPQLTAAQMIAADPSIRPMSALTEGHAFGNQKADVVHAYHGALYVDDYLADLISILHPELLPNRETVYLDPIEVS